MRNRVQVLVDVHERQRGVAEHLETLGATIEIRPLEAGDYVIAGGIVVERKQILDLHSALKRGRLWRQMGALRSAGGVPYLVVEGHSIDDGPLSPDAVRGACIAVLAMGVRLLQTKSPPDTARWLYRLAVRASRLNRRDRPAYAQRARRPYESPSEAMLGAVPGISATTARALLSEFGSLTNVLAHGPQDWQRVPGIGARRSAALAGALSDLHPATHSHPSRSSRHRREEPGPST